MGRPPKELATRAEAFARQPHVFVAPVHHPLVEQGRHAPVVPEALADQAFIMREAGSGTRASLEGFCDQSGFQPSVVMEMSNNETIKQAVMAGMGLSFLSLHTMGLELRHGLLAVLPVQGTPVTRDWNCVHALSKVLSPAAEAFRQFMLARGDAFLAQEFGGLLRTGRAG